MRENRTEPHTPTRSAHDTQETTGLPDMVTTPVLPMIFVLKRKLAFLQIQETIIMT
jgi:hypothetical protein